MCTYVLCRNPWAWADGLRCPTSDRELGIILFWPEMTGIRASCRPGISVDFRRESDRDALP